MNLNIMRGDNVAHYLQSQLYLLHEENSKIIDIVPASNLKTGLGHNFYFHKNIKKLTPEMLLGYFETNYTLLMEDEIKV